MTDATRRTIRTTVQTVLGLLAAIPLLVNAGDLPATLPGLATAVTVATVVTRVMANPAVNRRLPAWLRAAADPDAAAYRRATNE
ncbi:cell division protein FtsW (lipid II flippase) [Kitasatospora gansuensis]|uniref:Cell division protein FtsW (Lipid II flippase) n=1 Tax=Kitasatospora gansuensis TaxID=258050 RepID=A0A7W7WHS6_9ACTN|nr:hypothetical protein [Kitasatospora gansuensis]MBB4946814.1 cell division protein FtsW (lipid II flippase) [Kitasatospora gansuensis]